MYMPYSAYDFCFSLSRIPWKPKMGSGRFLTIGTMFVTVVAASDTPCPQVCTCPSRYKADCCDSSLTHIPEDLLSEVRFLNASGNNFHSLENGAFSVHRIKILDLSNNRISTIKKEALTELKDLICLYLGRNEIISLDEDVFRMNNRLEFLKLDKNNLDFPVDRPFLNIPSLRSLDLSSCNIRSLPKKTFIKVPSLEELRLSHNLLQTLDPISFLPLKSLKSLYLSNNLLRTLQDDLFVMLKELVILDLSNNKLQTLDPRAFMSLENVELLELSSNRLTIFEVGVFTPLVSLRRLHLHKNLLSKLDRMQFSELNSLEVLDLSRNHLNNLHLHTVCHLSNLTYLKVSENHLTCNCELWELWKWGVKKGVRILSACEELDYEFSENKFESFKFNESCNKISCDEEYVTEFPVKMLFPVYVYVIIVAVLLLLLIACGITAVVVFRRRKEFCKRRNIQVYVTHQDTSASLSGWHHDHTARLQLRQELQKELHRQHHETFLKNRVQRGRSTSLKTLHVAEQRNVRHSYHECHLPSVADDEREFSNADTLPANSRTSVFLARQTAHPIKQERLKTSKNRSVSEPKIKDCLKNLSVNETNSHKDLNPLSVSSLECHTPTEAPKFGSVYDVSSSESETVTVDKL
jgi:Leucine-rich repeat (LRR) protein